MSNLWYSTHDSKERTGKGVYVTGHQMPATRKSIEDRFFPVVYGLEAYIRKVNRLLNPDMSDSDFEANWLHMYSGNEAFDNFNGYTSGHWKLENLFCAGATLRAVTGRPVNNKIEVYAIDPQNPPNPPNKLSEIDMTLNFFPTVAAAPYRSEPFPWFNGRFVQPFVGKGGRNWVMVNPPEPYGKLKPVTKIMNPFSPERWDVTAGVINK